ncbi:MAG: putative bifunctional diguanylate cyclase/phosphodiesterase [Acidiferrobacterales bacterium]
MPKQTQFMMKGKQQAARFLVRARRYVRQNLISIVGGLLLITLTVTAGISVYAVMRRQAESLLAHSLAVSLYDRVNLVNEEIRQSFANARIIATRPVLIAAFRRLDRAPHAIPDRALLHGGAQSFRAAYGFTAISFRTLQGAEVARAGRFLQAPGLRIPLTTSQPATLLWHGQFFLGMRANIVDGQGRPVGSIRVELPLPLLTRALIHLRSFGRTASLAVCAPLGKEAMRCVAGAPGRANMRSGHVFARLPRTLQGHTLPMSYALAGQTGVVLTRNYLHKDVVAAYAPVGRLGLGMVLMVNQAELNGPVTDQLWIVGPLLVTLLLAGMLALRGMVTPMVRKLAQSEHEMQRANARLRESEMHARAVLDGVNDGIIAIHEDGIISLFNPAAERMFGYMERDIIGQNVSLLMPEPDRSQYHGHLRQSRETGNSTLFKSANEVDGVRRNGTKFPLELHVNEIRTDTGHLSIAVARDITERRRAEQELRIAATAFETGEGIVITDRDARILRVNHAYTRLTGYSAEELTGRTPAILHSGRQDVEFYRRLWETLMRDGYWQGEIWNRRKDGAVYLAWQTVTAVTDAKWQVTHYVGVSSDITRRKEAEQEIHRLAFYDPLTKLPNRSLLWDRLQQAQSYSARHGTHGALLFIDLDNFKTLNDTQGHHIGDLLLIEVAKRLQEGVRPSDTVARLGGDEFVVVLVDLSDDAQQAASQAQSLGKKLLVTLNQLYQLQEREQYSSASMGITVFRGDEIRITDLLKQADAAMYDAKSAERNALRFFDPAMQVVLEGRAALEADLRQAIPLRQLVLYYQAQVNEAQEMVGAEVLLRWQHPVRGLIPPMDFIPLAEDTGLIVPIGQWVLKEACAQLKVWQADPAMSHLGLSINVGAYQLRQPEFVDQVLGVLETAGVDPRKLTLELTESQMLDHMTVNINKIQELRRAGVRLSLDDFGTGQSSLAHLRYLPLDEIKIDQSFVRGITTDPDPNDTVTVIVQIIIWIAENLGLDLIAEGVETEQQHDFLRRNGCHRYQGYLFGKPVPIIEFQNRVRTDPRLQGDGTSEAAP